MSSTSFRSILVGSLGAVAVTVFLRVPLSPRFIAQMEEGESACDNVDNDGTGVVDEGCYACKAGKRFVLGNRTYCFSFASFGLDLSAADAECRSFGGQLASYTDGETRADVLEIIAKYVSIAHKQPVYPQALLIKNTCREMTAAFRQPDADMYQDTSAPPGMMDCSYPIIMHSGSQEGKLNDGTGGAGNGAVCEIMSGWCCITDGQVCIPMTLEQCDASGIGFAQDPATCNILCGVREGSSSSPPPPSSSISSLASVSSPTSSIPSSSRSPSSVSSVSSPRNASFSSSSRSSSSVSLASSVSSVSSASSSSRSSSSFSSFPSSSSRSSSSSVSSPASSSLSLSLIILPQCSDGIDNDGDSLRDSKDPGCHTDSDPNSPASYDPGDDDEQDRTSSRSSSPPSPPPLSSPFLSQSSASSGARENGEPCRNGTECQSDVCLGGMCIPCTVDLQCPVGNRCLTGQCRPFVATFSATLPTEKGICGDSLCSVMENAATCPQDCRAMAFSCSVGEECDTGLCRNGTCFPCTATADCPSGWQCFANRCLPPFSPQQAQMLGWPASRSPAQLLPDWQQQSLQPTTSSLPPRLPRRTTETGPELLAIMAAGAAGGWAFMRRKGWRKC